MGPDSEHGFFGIASLIRSALRMACDCDARWLNRPADKFGLPSTFTLDAGRHGGMTELGGGIDDGVGEGAIRAPHRSGLRKVCQGEHGTRPGRYSPAPRPILANEQGISIQNEAGEG